MLAFQKAYNKYAVGGLQLQEVSATPVYEADLLRMLQGLVPVALDVRKPVTAVVAARDGALFSIMWGTMMRGEEVGGLHVTGLRLADG